MTESLIYHLSRKKVNGEAVLELYQMCSVASEKQFKETGKNESFNAIIEDLDPHATRNAITTVYIFIIQSAIKNGTFDKTRFHNELVELTWVFTGQ